MQLLWQGEQSAVEAQAPQRMKLRLVRYNIKFGLELGMQEQVSTGLEQGASVGVEAPFCIIFMGNNGFTL